jgi:hypothetical protein
MVLRLPLHYQVNFNPNWIWRDVVVVRSSKPAVEIVETGWRTATLLMGGPKLV